MTTHKNNLRIVILRGKLLEGLSSVERAVGGDGASLPILRNVLLDARDSKITLTATNLDVVVRHDLTGKVLGGGAVTVPLAVLHSIARNLTSERITLEQEEMKVRLVTDNYEATVYGQPESDFPIIPTIQGTEPAFVFSTGVLRDVFSSVVVSTQFSDIRPEISGVFVSYADDQLVFVATDSFRLSEYVVPKEHFQAGRGKISFIIPLRTVQDFLKVFALGDDPVRVFVDQNQILFSGTDRSLFSRLGEGAFPDYAQIMPRNFSCRATLPRDDFLNAVKTVSTLSGRANDITISAGENKKFLEFFSSESTLGENIYKIPTRLEGDRFSAVFNYRFVLDGLKTYHGDSIILGVNGSDRPAALLSPSEPFLRYVVMPIRS